MLDEFNNIEGVRVTVEVDGGKILAPWGFDPMNVTHVLKGQVLHNRYLKLGSTAGSLETMGMKALTFAAGKHPLFNGVNKVLIAGFEAEPTVSLEGDKLTISSEGFSLEFAGASMERSGDDIIVKLLRTEQ